jgi:hypothetical protein
LAMTAARRDQIPAVIFYHPDCITYLHVERAIMNCLVPANIARMERAIIWDLAWGFMLCLGFRCTHPGYNSPRAG